MKKPTTINDLKIADLYYQIFIEETVKEAMEKNEQTKTESYKRVKRIIKIIKEKIKELKDEQKH